MFQIFGNLDICICQIGQGPNLPIGLELACYRVAWLVIIDSCKLLCWSQHVEQQDKGGKHTICWRSHFSEGFSSIFRALASALIGQHFPSRGESKICKVQICKICKTFEIWEMPKTCKIFYSFASEVKKRYISHIYICQVKMHNIFSSRPHAQNGEAVTQQIPRALQFIVHSPQETSSGGQSQEERKTPNLLISKVVKVSNYKELMM